MKILPKPKHLAQSWKIVLTILVLSKVFSLLKICKNGHDNKHEECDYFFESQEQEQKRKKNDEFQLFNKIELFHQSERTSYVDFGMIDSILWIILP